MASCAVAWDGQIAAITGGFAVARPGPGCAAVPYQLEPTIIIRLLPGLDSALVAHRGTRRSASGWIGDVAGVQPRPALRVVDQSQRRHEVTDAEPARVRRRRRLPGVCPRPSLRVGLVVHRLPPLSSVAGLVLGPCGAIAWITIGPNQARGVAGSDSGLRCADWFHGANGTTWCWPCPESDPGPSLREAG